jgi:TPR repeat protein
VRFWVLFLIACGGGAAKPRVETPPAPAPAPKPAVAKVEPPAPEPAKPCEANDECITRCDRGDAESCATIGARYDSGKGIAQDSEKAHEAFERACAQKHPEGCYQLALGWGDDQSRVANYRIACEANHALACTNLGARYGKGKGVTADPGRARELADKACKLGDSMGCSNLGMYMRDGTGGPKDMPKAIELSRKACDDGEGPACERLAEIYDEGNGVMRDQTVARKIYVRACELGAGCNNLGVMYLRGEGGDVDNEQAAQMFTKACDKDDATGCLNLARIKRNGTLHGNINLADAAELYHRACQAGNKEACDELDPTVEQTKQKCAKSAKDCNNWGYLNEHGYGVPQSMTAALKLYEKACKAKDSNACYNIGNIFANGRGGITVDVKKGLKFYDTACKLNDDDACANAAKLRAQ